MFQDFAKKKFEDYLALLEFPAGRISFSQIRASTLPPFIISFFEHYVPKKNIPLNRNDFSEILNKAIIFNINYIIKPKNTILKFIFGEVETRPVHFVKDRLRYFQFYGYYITQVADFININMLEVVSSNQVEHLINDVNKKLYDEIRQPNSGQQRMNLVKLLYYFFHDLGVNNPINIKIPRKILSVYFQDKGYYDIKKRVDGFFSDEIFIQEALELMDPETRRSPAPEPDIDISDEKIDEMITKAKQSKGQSPVEQTKGIRLISTSALNKEVEKILQPEDEILLEIPAISAESLREQESKLPEVEKSRLVVDEEIYSDDLMFASQFSDMAPPLQLSEREIRDNLIKDLFCEESYKKKIIKNVFKKSEEKFYEGVNKVLDLKTWDEAAGFIEKLYEQNRVNYFSEPAVKFVDILQSHFMKDSWEDAGKKNNDKRKEKNG